MPDEEANMKNVNTLSAVIYLGISLLGGGLFLLSTMSGSYTAVERFGGAGWVFFLSTIILMPIVIPMVKKRMGS
jgi:hypothetical protein